MLMNIPRVFVFLFSLMAIGSGANAQLFKDGKLPLNADGTQYLKFGFGNQIWVRHTEMNPGSTINGYAKSSYSDIGIRRVRINFSGQLTDRVFFYTMIGENNFNFLSDRKLGLCVLDAVGEYAAIKTKLSFGAGLTGWGGLSRFSSPATASFNGIDAPLYQQATVDMNDQLLRKLSVYAKGKLGDLDYRVAMNHPLAVHKASGYNANIGKYSSYSAEPAQMQWSGYFQWQMLDKESNVTPYTVGNYIGEKNVFNVGAGFLHQQDAMWRVAAEGNDTIRSSMNHIAVDVFLDKVLNRSKKTSFNAYAAWIRYDFGDGYIRNFATMNPANGGTQKDLINGHGNGFPAVGTGNVFYVQVAYKFAENLIGKTTLMPYASIQHADYDRLNDRMNYIDAGINWLLKGNTSKLTLALQNRPLFYVDALTGQGTRQGTRNSMVLQYSISFP